MIDKKRIQKRDTQSLVDTEISSSDIFGDNYLLDQYVAQIVVLIYILKYLGSEYSSMWAHLDYGPKYLLWVQSSFTLLLFILLFFNKIEMCILAGIIMKN